MMKWRSILVIWVMAACCISAAAQSDLLLLRKHSKTIQRFYPGIDMQFFLDQGQPVSGHITAIKRDSIFMDQFDVRRYMTPYGATGLDTITTWHVAYAITDIKAFPKTTAFKNVLLADMMMIGAAAYAGLNVVNAAILNESLTGKQNLERLGIAAGVFGIGRLLKGFRKDRILLGRKYKLVYVPLTDR